MSQCKVCGIIIDQVDTTHLDNVFYCSTECIIRDSLITKDNQQSNKNKDNFINIPSKK